MLKFKNGAYRASKMTQWLRDHIFLRKDPSKSKKFTLIVLSLPVFSKSTYCLFFTVIMH